jgi:hypothetical protein
MECSTIKAPLEVCCFVHPHAVKEAEIIPWIPHSRVMPASLEQECIPDPASSYKITLQNTSTLPQQDPTSQETTGHHR